ncbi:MAG TPA: amino acid ABC transporter substrate-binding protein [Limnochordales bacterium]
MSGRPGGGIGRRELLKAGAGALGAAWMASTRGVRGAERPIRIGASLSLTGRYARTGEEQYRGYQLWVEHINRFGASFGKENLPNRSERGLLGRPVELVVLDDRSDPTTGVRLYNELVYRHGVDLLLGPYSSAVTNAVAPVIEQARIPTPNPMASSVGIWQGKRLRWQVQIQPPASKRLPGVEEVAAQRGDRKVAIIYEDTEFPRDAVRALRQRFTRAGLEIVLDQAYPAQTTDWTPIIQQVQRSGATVLVGGGYLPDAVGIMRALRSLRFSPNIVSLLVGVALPDFEGTLGRDALYATGDADWVPWAGFPGNRQFVEAYREKWGRDPEYHAAGGYAGGQILEEAVKRVGRLDLEAIRDVMFSLDTATVFGRYKVQPLDSPDSGLQVAADRVMLQVQEQGGRLVKPVVYPPDAATASWVYPFRLA